jgi:phosphohistidine phosphatase
MKIYVVRHGESLSTSPDDTRPLSEKGKDDIKRLANFIVHLNIKVNRIVHSPKYRAQETAEILSSAISLFGTIETSAQLDPLASISHIINQFNVWEGDSLIVGHMPFMGKLVNKLTSGDEDNNVVIFKPGNIVCLELTERERWSICWMLTPILLK